MQDYLLDYIMVYYSYYEKSRNVLNALLRRENYAGAG
jgi:hypothetical protein